MSGNNTLKGIGFVEGIVMSRKTVENGLWGHKGELKEGFEGTVLPTWLNVRLDSLSSHQKKVADPENDIEKRTVRVKVDASSDALPDDISERMSEWIEENHRPKSWGIEFEYSGRGSVDQSSMRLFAEV